MSGSNTLTLSVKELVEFSARSGDLLHYQNGPTTIEGIRGHQEIQKKRAETWQKELSLEASFKCESYMVTLQGRVDLLYEDFVSSIVEEIKTTYHPPAHIPEAKKQLHKAQARVYAYLYSLKNPGRSIIDVRVTWFDLANQKIYSDTEQIHAAELQQYTHNLVAIYIKWHGAVEASREMTRSTAQKLQFPYPKFRNQQRNFAGLVFQSIKQGNDLLVEAPTGSGKTIATIFPSVKALGENLVQQVCYVTQKNSAAAAAESAVDALMEKNLYLTVTRIQARDKTCPCKRAEDSSALLNEDGVCCRTLGYYERLPAARLDALNLGILNGEAIELLATKHNICPFELSIELARWSSIIVCDANYVFDPMTRLSFFDAYPSSRTLLIDETHNLIERGRDMYSAKLDTQGLSSLASTLKRTSERLATAIQAITDTIYSLPGDSTLFDKPPKSIISAIENVINELNSAESKKLFPKVFSEDKKQDSENTLRAIFKFRTILDLYSKAHITTIESKQNSSILKLFCRDPSEHLKKIHKSYLCTIGFSATLRPIEFYKRSLGFAKDIGAFALPSIFPKENQLTLRCDFIDTRWQQREHSLESLTRLVFTIQDAKPGNYLVYLPSYSYLQMLYKHFQKQYPHIRTIVQDREANEQTRITFIDTFISTAKTGKSSLVGFAILGGIFAEGLDFIGDTLRGAVVVGLGMPQPGNEQKILEAYYQQRGLNAFQYVYQFPGLTRVLQTGGRVIRSEQDKGVVVLVDPRLKQSTFSALLPSHWHIKPMGNACEMDRALTQFWHDK